LSINSYNQKNIKKNSGGFFTAVEGIGVPIGSFDDPKSKAGLAALGIKLYKYGTQNYPNIVSLYREIENLGGRLFWSRNRDSILGGIQVPVSKQQDARLLFQEILDNVCFDQKDLKKAKETQKMEIAELQSKDTQYALHELYNMVLDTNSFLGTQKSLESISAVDVKNLHEKISEDKNAISVASSEVWSCDKGSDYYVDAQKVPQLKAADVVKAAKVEDRVKFIEQDIPQKVLLFGVPMKAAASYDFVLVSVIKRILSNGLVGLLPEVIREKHSAAYYAYASTSLYRKRSLLYMASGVSEQNLVKVVELIRGIIGRLQSGDFDDSLLVTAKTKTKAILDQILDSPSNIFDLYTSFVLRGIDVIDYDSWVERINAVTKEDAVGFFKDVFGDSKLFMVVNGKIGDKVKNTCKDLLK
jgi:predicted Zn-dependent peptidase